MVGGSLLLLTDYDGTLAPIVRDPGEARLGRTVRASLSRLARSPRVRVAVISGRALDDLRRRVGVDKVIYAGCHGLEVEGPGLAFTHPQAAARRGALRAVARDLRRRAAPIPGVRVEAKGLAVAVHYRSGPPDAAQRLEREVEGALRGQRGVLEVLSGKKVIEILPRARWDKRACARWIVDRVAPTLPTPIAVLVLGDDRTDEAAFGVLGATAITIRVGSDGEGSRARYRLRDVTAVGRLLSALATAATRSRRGRS